MEIENTPSDTASDSLTDKTAAKLAKIERERKELLASLAAADFSSQKAKVAYILNLYPLSRNSDVTLSIKYWETFQPDIYNPSGIPPLSLFKLERMHYLVRARAKIQNEYGLFVADSEIRRSRRQREETMLENVREDSSPRKLVSIFADESGKTQKFLIVSSVWVLTGRAVYEVTHAIQSWRESSGRVNKEIHFNRFSRTDMDTLREYLAVIVKNREFLSFKTVAVERAKSRRSVVELVEKLHETMLKLGVDHEIQSGRISPPQKIEVTVDHEDSLDPIALVELRRRVNLDYAHRYGDTVDLAKIDAISSKNSELVQLSDLVAGAINRKLNQENTGHYKDDMADLILTMLEINLVESEFSDLDTSALFKF